MSLDTEITRFGVAVIESIPVGQLHTGGMLCQNVLQPRLASDDSLFYDLYKVETYEEFKGAFNSIIQKHQENEMLALHIETHGCEDGIGLASGELVPWNEFLNLCRELNVALNGLLNVTTALCYSISLMAAIDPTKRAPFKAIVITRRIVTNDEIIRGYTKYFKIYKSILDVGPAKEALRKEVNDGTVTTSPFEMITSEWLFDQITNPDNNPEGFPHIVNEWYCIKRSEDPSYTKDRVEMELRQLFKEIAVKGRDYYTFKDIFIKKSTNE